MSIATYQKDPAAKLDYTIDWSDWLAGEQIISSSEWPDVPSELTKLAEASTDTSALVRLSGGVWGRQYLVRNHVTLSNGEEDWRTITIDCAPQ